MMARQRALPSLGVSGLLDELEQRLDTPPRRSSAAARQNCAGPSSDAVPQSPTDDFISQLCRELDRDAAVGQDATAAAAEDEAQVAENVCTALDATCDLIVEGFALLDRAPHPRNQGRQRLDAAVARSDHTTWWLSLPDDASVQDSGARGDDSCISDSSLASSPVDFRMY
eukprot:TRINITY_DN68179_c0_g1_i1.p2 TRINITY_DN68179_c0_g1~~TRINITY_DN68179_c0_g1_i1.p2  ORF type:complete len:170 (-),score=26.93 TRINITY_DN68179_c0_g1_i1:121-630(-)